MVVNKIIEIFLKQNLSFFSSTVLCSLFGLREATVNFERDVKSSMFNFVSENDFIEVKGKCTLQETLIGLHFKFTIAAVIILIVAILFYLIHWKYPREREILNQQQSNVERLHQLMQQKYHLMSHVSTGGSIPV